MTFGPQIKVNAFGGGLNWQEPASAASQINENELGIISYGGRYAITIDGGASFSHGSFPVIVTDPLAACAPGSGRIVLGGQTASFPPGTKIAFTYREPGETTVGQHPLNVVLPVGDRPSMAGGPLMPASPEPVRTWVMSYNYRPGGVGNCHTHPSGGGTGPIHASMMAETAGGTLGPFTTRRLEPSNPITPCDYEGWGAASVVCDDGTIVVATADAICENTNPARCPVLNAGIYNERRPFVLFSTDGGTVWNPIEYPPIRLEGDPPIQITRRYGELNDLGDSPYRVDKRTNSPAIAVDRSATPNIVYVAFYGRSAQGPEQEDRNTDVYIFRGTDNGRSWGNTPGEHYIHITDASLGIAPGLITTQGPDQCGLALAVDCTGALCLMFYDNRHDQAPPAYTNNRLDVYFIRVAWPSSGPWSLLSQARLTPTTFPAAPDLMMGDFFHLPVAGEAQRRLYPVYVAREPDGMGGWTPRNLYTHKITVNLCPAGPMGLRFRPEHAEPLARAVLEEKPDGDLNGDDRVDLEDLALLEYWISNDRGSR